MSYIVITGDPVSGFRYRGPIESGDDLDAQHREFRNDYWWIAELEAMPEEA